MPFEVNTSLLEEVWQALEHTGLQGCGRPDAAAGRITAVSIDASQLRVLLRVPARWLRGDDLGEVAGVLHRVPGLSGLTVEVKPHRGALSARARTEGPERSGGRHDACVSTATRGRLRGWLVDAVHPASTWDDECQTARVLIRAGLSTPDSNGAAAHSPSGAA